MLKGMVSVISATARKLAVIIWNMVAKPKEPLFSQHTARLTDLKK